MYSPLISSVEHALNPLPSGKDSVHSLLPLQSFSEKTPFLVKITPCLALSQVYFNPFQLVPSLILDTTLITQTNDYPEFFWSKSNSLERS